VDLVDFTDLVDLVDFLFFRDFPLLSFGLEAVEAALQLLHLPADLLFTVAGREEDVVRVRPLAAS
jgi:hypothetical protein